MIAVIVDTTKVEPDEEPRFTIFVNTKRRATKTYSKLKKTLTGVEIKISGDFDMTPSQFVEFLAWLGSFFAEYKESVIIYHEDTVTVFVKRGCPI